MIFSLFLLCNAQSSFAQPSTLVTDLNTRRLDGYGSSPSWPSSYENRYNFRGEEFVEIAPGVVLFVACNELIGCELWKTDGTPQGTVLVKDIYPGSRGSNPTDLTNYRGVLFFGATDGVHGTELWRSDGTPEGTYMVLDQKPGVASGVVAYPTLFQDQLVFVSTVTGLSGGYLFQTDGTTEGTRPLFDPALSPTSIVGRILGVIDNEIYFSGSYSYELWKTDGTPEGTLLVKDIVPGTSSGDLTSSIVFANKLFFVSLDNNLWVSDGTADGTRFLDFIIGKIIATDDKLYFNSTRYPRTIWTTDGTLEGTVPLFSDLREIRIDGPAAVIGNTLYFASYDNLLRRYVLWKTDGTVSGTVVVSDAMEPDQMANVNGTLLFIGLSLTDWTPSLWRSDGTSEGTTMVSVLRSPPSKGRVFRLTPINNHVFFFNNDGFTGLEPWISDGTAEGTYLLKDINRHTADGITSNLVYFKGLAYFGANDNIHGSELWRSDGTLAGTQLVADLVPGFTGSNPTNLVVLDNVLYFLAATPETGTELWRSDGTPGGTMLVKDIFPGPSSSNVRSPTVSNGRIFFTATDGLVGEELWVTDGTPSGTSLVKDVAPAYLSAFDSQLTPVLVDVNGTLFFAPYHPDTGRELWRSDGTTDGTLLVKDIHPGPNPSFYSSYMSGVNYHGRYYFIANDGNGRDLWQSDGTLQGTSRVFDIPAIGNLFNSFLVILNNKLIFVGYDPLTGYELWTSDGTTSGTMLLKDVCPGSESGYAQNVRPQLIENTLYFMGYSPEAGREIWKTDGTPDGTVLVKDIKPGPGSLFSSTASFSSSIGLLIISTGDIFPATWISDGTSEGTYPINPTDLGPDAVFIGGRIVFAAKDPLLGNELFRIGPAEPSLTGSCCIAGVCSMLVPVDCYALGGFYGGDYTPCMILGHSGSPCCESDYDLNGSVDIQDLLMFLNLWFTEFGTCHAPSTCTSDFDGNGATEVRDIFAYLQTWFAQFGSCGM